AIPLFQGADTHVAGQYRPVDMQVTPILEFARNEAYGAMATGLVIWSLGSSGYEFRPMSESVIKDFRVWHNYATGYYGYPVQHLTFDGYVVRGDVRCLNQ